ncbi:MAG: adenylyl-sulfate kinase, partial [Saprospiraceae bacterium]
MKNTDNNIHPIYDRLLSRNDRSNVLGQNSKVLWLTGLSGSGKSTIAEALERKLHNNGFFAQVLDGDNIRDGINSNLGFSVEDRKENIRRIAEIAKLYLNTG